MKTLKYKKGDILKTKDIYYRKVLSIINDEFYLLSESCYDSPQHSELNEPDYIQSEKYLDDNGYTLHTREEEKWIPKEGESYYVPAFSKDNKHYLFSNQEDKDDKSYTEKGLAFKTKEEAIIKHDLMLSAK